LASVGLVASAENLQGRQQLRRELADIEGKLRTNQEMLESYGAWYGEAEILREAPPARVEATEARSVSLRGERADRERHGGGCRRGMTSAFSDGSERV
jgi:hypothetical protein